MRFTVSRKQGQVTTTHFEFATPSATVSTTCVHIPEPDTASGYLFLRHQLPTAASGPPHPYCIQHRTQQHIQQSTQHSRDMAAAESNTEVPATTTETLRPLTDEEMRAEHGKYLREQMGITDEPDIEPPPKKRKTTKKGVVKGDEGNDQDAAAGSLAKTTPKAPRNAGTGRKRKASEAGDLTTDASSAEEQKHDSPLTSPAITGVASDEPAPPAKKAKAAPKKHKIAETTDATSSSPEGVAPTEATAPPPEKSAGKKRKAAPVEADTASNVAAADELGEALPLPKKTKRSAPKDPNATKPKRQAKGKKKAQEHEEETANISAAAPPPLPELHWAVALKVKRVYEFLDTIDPAKQTGLIRDPTNPDLAGVREYDLLGALYRLVQDYQIDVAANFENIESIIVDKTPQTPKGSDENSFHIFTIDLSKHSAIEAAVQEKVAGYELEDYNLLEVELEMLLRENAQQREPWAVDRAKMSQPVDFAEFMALVQEKRQADEALAYRDAVKEAVVIEKWSLQL
jgi:hypothetical protein